MSDEINKVLSELYHSLKSDVSYSSPIRLYKKQKKVLPTLTLKNVKEWLSSYISHIPFIIPLEEIIQQDELSPTKLMVIGKQILQIFKIYQSLMKDIDCLLYTSPSPRDATLSRMPSSA